MDTVASLKRLKQPMPGHSAVRERRRQRARYTKVTGRIPRTTANQLRKFGRHFIEVAGVSCGESLIEQLVCRLSRPLL
jgi:hypothetical protein